MAAVHNKQLRSSRLIQTALPGGPRKRTWIDGLLVGLWVHGYAAVLVVFRITKALEHLLSSSKQNVPRLRRD
jgi:hypothetical protein